LIETEIASFDTTSRKTPQQNQTWSGSGCPLPRYDH